MKKLFLFLVVLVSLTLTACDGEIKVEELRCTKNNVVISYYYDDEGVLDIILDGKTPDFNSGYEYIKTDLDTYLESVEETHLQDGYTCSVYDAE